MKDLDCEGLFGNIESILKISQKLLNRLETAVEDQEGKDQELGNHVCLDIFVTFTIFYYINYSVLWVLATEKCRIRTRVLSDIVSNTCLDMYF